MREGAENLLTVEEFKQMGVRSGFKCSGLLNVSQFPGLETFQTEGAAYEKERCQNVFERTCATPRVPESQGELSPTEALSGMST